MGAYQERFARHGDVRIRYLDNDPEEPLGLPVVFVPGITDFADEYEAVFELLGSRRLLVVELRGRGGSDAPRRGYTPAELAGDVSAVLDAERIGRFHLMAFSRGTTPSIELATARPGQVVTLSIGDYPAAEIGLLPPFAESHWQGRFRGVPVAQRVQRHVLEGIQADSTTRELWDEVGALGVPVLVARGSRGGVVGDAHAEQYRRRVPGVEMMTIPDAGHDLFRPDRTAYPRAVLEMIARRAPGT